MKVASAIGETCVLNVERGEELHATLLNFCKKEGIQGAVFTGLGAADEIELAYYHLPTKEYERHNIQEEVEIVSLTGNLGTLDGSSILHVHGVFGKRDLTTVGGHIFSLRVSGACEIHLTTVSSPLLRAYDDTTGLNLLCGA